MNHGFDPRSIERPDPLLMRYYLLRSFLAGPAFPIALLASWMRYITLRYKFDTDGVSMSYGVFFRREVNLTYRRLQDIHLTHNIIQRWMGLATISLQTASGSATAEMMIEGVLEAEALRDYLYARMRGARDEHQVVDAIVADGFHSPQSLDAALQQSLPPTQPAESTDVLKTLEEIRNALQKLVDRQEVKS